MLLEPESNMQVPLIIGQSEAQSILLAKETVKTRRPMTHGLMLHIMEAYELHLEQVTIDRVVEGIFYATLHLTDGFNKKRLDSRTTDAIALALHADAPIFMDEAVLEETGVKADPPSAINEEPSTLENLEEELRRCEEKEDYERAAEIQQKIDTLRNER